MNKYISKQLSLLKENGVLTVLYALLLELVFVGYVIFASLFTVETLLPTFVTVRFSLAKFLFFLVLLSFLLTYVGQLIGVSHSWKIKKTNPLLWVGIMWSVSLLAVSLYKFPPFFILVLISGFILCAFFFAKIFVFDEK